MIHKKQGHRSVRSVGVGAEGEEEDDTCCGAAPIAEVVVDLGSMDPHHTTIVRSLGIEVL